MGGEHVRQGLAQLERGTWQQIAAVHRHSLDRLNTINESPPSKKKSPQAQLMKEMGKVEDANCVCDGWTHKTQPICMNARGWGMGQGGPRNGNEG